MSGGLASVEDLVLTRDLVQRGFTAAEVAQMERNGELVRLRRGAYARRQGEPDPPEVDDEHARLAARHRQLIDATLGQLHPRAVISHGSAAVLHGLPVFTDALQQVHVTRDRHGGGVLRSPVRVHGSRLRDSDVSVCDGITVTSLARTVGDLARTLPFDQAVAVGDHAHRIGVELAELADVLDFAARWVGVSQARRVAAFIDGRSESVGESFSRTRFHELGVPTPALQHDVFDDHGLHVGRADFAWPEFHTLGEFDGKIKYRRALRRPEETVEQAVIREKLREDRLRDLGWQVVRWVWEELFRAEVIVERLNRAFARGRR